MALRRGKSWRACNRRNDTARFQPIKKHWPMDPARVTEMDQRSGVEPTLRQGRPIIPDLLEEESAILGNSMAMGVELHIHNPSIERADFFASHQAKQTQLE